MVSCSAFLVECLKALYHSVFGVFGSVLDREITYTYLRKSSWEPHNFRMTPKVHVLVPHVPQYVRRSGVQLGPTFEQALESEN